MNSGASKHNAPARIVPIRFRLKTWSALQFDYQREASKRTSNSALRSLQIVLGFLIGFSAKQLSVRRLGQADSREGNHQARPIPYYPKDARDLMIVTIDSRQLITFGRSS